MARRKRIDNDLLIREEPVKKEVNVEFIKEPGYTFDLFMLFAMYFNKKNWLPTIINYNKKSEDIEYFNKVLDDYLPISDDLLIFFYMCENNKMFMSEKYYREYKNDLITGKYSLSKILVDLSDYEKVINNVIHFYFRDIPEDYLVGDSKKLSEVNKLVKESCYNSDIKSALLSFFIDPVPVIQKLMYELMAKEIIMSRIYEVRYSQLTSVQKAFSHEGLVKALKEVKDRSVDIEGIDTIYISFCIHQKNVVRSMFYADSVLMMLGIDYLDVLEFRADNSRFPDFATFGNAMAEKNRVEILNYISRKDEVTIKEVEQDLGFTSANAYYHLSLMIKANVLGTRNQGRTILYSINKEYFEEIGNLLLKYAK